MERTTKARRAEARPPRPRRRHQALEMPVFIFQWELTASGRAAPTCPTPKTINNQSERQKEFRFAPPINSGNSQGLN